MPGIKDFRNKVAVVTGAGSGIGRATALALGEKGAILALVDVNADRIASVAGEIEALGGQSSQHTVDVSKPDQMEALSETVIKTHGQVDILFNNAGVSIGAKMENMTLEDWRWIVSINYWGVVHGIHFFLPHMIAAQSGHIINTSSILGLASAPGVAAYASTKFAVAGIGEALRAEVRRYDIGVTTLCPGVINTRIVEDGRMALPEGAKVSKGLLVDFYKKRGWPPERVANAVVKAIRKNIAIQPVGPEAWGQWFLKRTTARGYNAMLGLLEKRLLG